MKMRWNFVLTYALVLAATVTSHAAMLPEYLASDPVTEVREAATYGQSTERHLSTDRPLTPWTLDPAIFAQDQGDKVEVRQMVVPDVRTVKLANQVPAIHFAEGDAEIPPGYLNRLRDILASMRDKENVRLHFIGHADSQPLSAELQAIFTDNIGLSRERAGTVAEYCQRQLNLPPEGISYEGLGDSQPVADNATEQGRALNRRVEVEVWYDKIGEKTVDQEVPVPRAVNRVKICRTETVCKLRYLEGHAHRARVRNLVAPLHYDEGQLQLSEPFIRQIAQVRENLLGRKNLQLKFVAYSDDAPLIGRQKRIYGNHLALSKAMAHRLSLAVREALDLPQNAVASEGRGTERPVATNSTPRGRALNRRIEVEFWYDDPLQDLPDEPQICPEASGAETVTRTYDSPAGQITPILYENGEPTIPAATLAQMRRVLTELSGKTRPRLRFVGYISNERLSRRTARIYGDDIGWSTVRARRALVAAAKLLNLPEAQFESEGRGYVQSDDVVNTGFIESDSSRVEVQAIYDELAILDDYEGVEITRLTRVVKTQNPFALNMMRITVDGTPVDDPGKNIADVQRCTDVALQRAQVRFKHDSLKREPRLNVTAWPVSVRYQDVEETDFNESRVAFQLYTNYRSFISRAEVRIFDQQQAVRDLPLAVVAVDENGRASWTADFATYSAPGRSLKYLVRVYDQNGLFDETATQPLWIVDQVNPRVVAANPEAELLAGYGESRLALRNIPLTGGTIQAHGSAIPGGYEVWLAGYPVPVDAKGAFVAEEILPAGLHTVEVAVLDRNGNGELFLRDLELARADWFNVGIADLTFSANKTNGPAKLLDPDNPRYSEDFSLQGRLAFYSSGRFENGWSLTASADTREGPLDEIFSNFIEKSGDALFRRMDPDRHYPTFGDDSTLMEAAPTDGKFFLRMKKDETYGLWGNFKIAYADNDLAYFDRGLYGANVHYQPPATTSFGEPRLVLDGFGADPGTISGRDEFRGTGGSLFYLQQQDILEGSERLRIEVRDKDSDLVLASKTLVAELDYDIDYLQGRVLLSEILPTTADDDLLVATASLSGNPVFLVVRYEYTPGVAEPDTLVTGGRMHYWLTDQVKVGLTAGQTKEDNVESQLEGVDLTLRKSSASWLKLEYGHTTGPGVFSSTSYDGGYSFAADQSVAAEDQDATAYRVEGSINFAEFTELWDGRLTFYLQQVGAGYSAPGLTTEHELEQYGGSADLPITASLSGRLKLDRQTEEEGIETTSGELDLDYRLYDNWTLSAGVRSESRKDNAPDVVATQEEGDLTDGVARVTYDSRERWTAYGFVQETLQATGNREDNGRVGAGGSWRLTDRFKVLGEVSEGDLGTGASFGTEFLYSDRTTLYTNYTLENERTDNGVLARKGNMVSGFRQRYSDSASVYLEEQYTHGDVPTGLVHSTGVELAITERLNLSANLDLGTLKDPDTAAALERTAAGLSIGYSFGKLAFANGVEYRVDNSEQPDASYSERTTWLFKNSFKFQLTDDWRIVGKFNHAQSESSLGAGFDGDYTEAVLGYAYRPVSFDRLNVLVKYTYFYNLPASDDASASSSDFSQRSHIAAIDLTYDLTPRWTLGGKYAYRLGQVAQDRENPEYYDSRAQLYVLRADWHFIQRWDALVEARMLDLPDAEDRRSGALVSLYRHVGEHVKVGAGYNFSDFSDDLTQLDYRHQGFFINLIGKL